MIPGCAIAEAVLDISSDSENVTDLEEVTHLEQMRCRLMRPELHTPAQVGMSGIKQKCHAPFSLSLSHHRCETSPKGYLSMFIWAQRPAFPLNISCSYISGVGAMKFRLLPTVHKFLRLRTAVIPALHPFEEMTILPHNPLSLTKWLIGSPVQSQC